MDNQIFSTLLTIVILSCILDHIQKFLNLKQVKAAKRCASFNKNENMSFLVGVNTLIKDDPELTARIPKGRKPIRIILDSNLRIPLNNKEIVDKLAETLSFTSLCVDLNNEEKLLSKGIKVIRAKGDKQVSIQIEEYDDYYLLTLETIHVYNCVLITKSQ